MNATMAWHRNARGVWLRSYGYGLPAVVSSEQAYCDCGKPIEGKTCWLYSLGVEQCGDEFDTAEEAMKACDESAVDTARSTLRACGAIQ